MGKANSFSISCSKKINSMWSLYSSQYWYQFHPIFLQRNTSGKLRRETSWNFRDVQKQKSLYFSNTVENTDKHAFRLRGTYLEKTIQLVHIQIISTAFMSDLRRLQFFGFSGHQGSITVVKMILFLAVVESPLHLLNN